MPLTENEFEDLIGRQDDEVPHRRLCVLILATLDVVCSRFVPAGASSDVAAQVTGRFALAWVSCGATHS